MTTLKVDVVRLLKRLDEVKSIHLSTLFNQLRFLTASTDILVSSEVPSAAMTRDVAMANDVYDVSQAQTYIDDVGVCDATMHDDYDDLKVAMVETVFKASLRDTSMVGYS